MGANLITLNEYKTYVGITSTAQDTIINTLIPIVSQFTKTFCNRTFVDYVNDSKVEVLRGGHSKIYLKEYPLLGIDFIESSIDYGASHTTLVEFTDYTLDAEDGSIQSLGLPEFKSYVNGYRISYTAGYETIPPDLKVAVMDLLTYYLKNDAAVKSQRTAGSSTVQVEYITTNALPAHIGRVFNMYKSEWN